MQNSNAFEKKLISSLGYWLNKKLLLFTMKVSAGVFILMLATFQLWAYSSSAQSIRTTYITLKTSEQSLKRTLDKIGQLSGFNMAYPSEIVDGYTAVDLKKESRTVYETLRLLLENTPLQFNQQGHSIVISVKKEKLTAIKEPRLQDILIRGRITDEKGEPLPGTVVTIKGTKTSTSANAEGAYSIRVANREAILIFSSLGFISQEIKIGNNASINIRLKEQYNALNEVVVVGYGSVKRADLTGAVGEVKVEDLAKAPVASFEQALAGRVAGVNVSAQEDGQPGSEMNIVIRGTNSITQANSPLYVIDGFPIENPQSAGINPDDIESISILKDASATAIYGARGANGVIVIELKKGKEGRSVVSFSTSLGYDKVTKTMEMLSPYEFVRYELERYPDPANQLHYLDDGRDLEYFRNVKGTDWQDALFNTGSTQIYNLSLRGGNKQTKYSISGSMFDNKAVIVNTGYKKYQARVAVDQTISKKVKAGVNVNFSNQFTYGQLTGRTSSTTRTVSGYLLYSVWAYRPFSLSGNNEDFEEDILDYDIDTDDDFRINPVVSAKNTLRERRFNNITANAYLTYDFTKNLTLKISAGINGLLTRNDAFYNSKTAKGSPLRVNNVQGMNGSVDYGERSDWVNENILTWKKTFGARHKLDMVGGFTVQGAANSAYGYSAIYVPNEELGINGLSLGTPLETTSASSYNRLASFLMRANYSYRSKYLFTATFRADASSKFAPGNRWGYFPSGAFAWHMDKEKFMKKLPFISTSKIRVSYGVTGNNRVSDFAYLPSIAFPDLGSYSFNNERFYGLNMDNLGNKNLKWESTAQTDIGYELGLFKDRINITADVYRKTTSDLLLDANLPYTTGYSSSYRNIGKVRNEGLELTLNIINVKNKKFSWESNFNISFNRNKVMELAESENSLMSYISNFSSKIADEPMYIAEVGKPVAMFYGLIWDGVYQYSDFEGGRLKLNVPTNGDARDQIRPGDIKYKDLNGDGVVDAYDKTVIGRALPIHTGGFSNNFSYKRFDLNVLFQWSYGNMIMNANRLIFEGNIGNRNHINQFASWANRWTPENQSNTLFRTGGAGPSVISSRVLEDGSYLRLKTVVLGYSLPLSMAKKLSMTELKLNVAVQNLYTWTNYSGLDPEVSVNRSVLTPGWDYSAYPKQRTVVFGVKATF